MEISLMEVLCLESPSRKVRNDVWVRFAPFIPICNAHFIELVEMFFVGHVESWRWLGPGLGGRRALLGLLPA